MNLNGDLLEIEDGLKKLLNQLKNVDKIEDDSVDLTLSKIERKIDLLRELVDFRLGKID